ncbi:contact-dependent growth inhibition system immunity protein [Johnsonella ignava]|uniref:contact-dependent growth inhibition system immunity protein n=1 Tax=Johnsonella ignava TaxID=43995 RepID=UPI0023F32E7A|nr:contact-dependent growth inhibition system immunity protein [Johnsonella ignava]
MAGKTRLKIKDIYNIRYDPASFSEYDRQTSPMPEWYEKVIYKTIEELTVFDIWRMFMQERFVDTAVKRAIVYLKEDPFCSEIIDGDIMKFVSEVNIEFVKDFKEELLGIIANARKLKDEYDWMTEDDEIRYIAAIDKFEKKLLDLNN